MGQEKKHISQHVDPERLRRKADLLECYTHSKSHKIRNIQIFFTAFQKPKTLIDLGRKVFINRTVKSSKYFFASLGYLYKTPSLKIQTRRISHLKHDFYARVKFAFIWPSWWKIVIRKYHLFFEQDIFVLTVTLTIQYGKSCQLHGSFKSFGNPTIHQQKLAFWYSENQTQTT